MSTWVGRSFSCSACARSITMRLATSVHITRVPEARSAVLDRSLHRVTCACGQKVAADVAFTYVDIERGHWIQIEPAARRAEWAAIETETMRALTRGLDLTSPIISGLAESARRRVVFGLEELREKLVAWDAGIDDGLLECIKLRAWIDHAALMRAPLVLDRMTDDGGLALLRADEPPERAFAVPASWVDGVLDEMPSLAARYPELFRGGFVNMLRLMAIVMIILAGCSQPHGRAVPAPRPRDAAVADAGAADVAVVPIDVSADAARQKVSWQAILDTDQGAANMRVAATLMTQQYKDSEMEVVFDRGKYSGVQVGWKGRMLDRDDFPIFDVFEVTVVDNRSCRARIKANPDELARTSRHAVLWNPNVAGAEPTSVR